MPVRSLNTFIGLPPGALSSTQVRTLFQRLFEEYRWFRPARFGFASPDAKLPAGPIDYDLLATSFAKQQSLTIAAPTDRDFVLLHLATADDPPFTGSLTWVTSAREAELPAWRAAHLRQVVEVMRMLNAPLAQAALSEELDRKMWRLVPGPSGVGQEEVFTVQDYSEGLAGLGWRNFFGPPFVRLFGERLATLPPGTREDVGDGIVLVQPYELPTQAGTPEGEARERQLIAHLGPECFYDHERHTLPTRRPLLPHG